MQIPKTVATISARDFIARWGLGGPSHDLSERAGAQAHFIDLCRVLGLPEPGQADRYTFEKGVNRTGSGTVRMNGFADVWLKGCFAWEYKAPGGKLGPALAQLMRYALPLESPPLLVVSDRLRIEVHTHFTGTPSECHEFALEDLIRPEVQHRLRQVWEAPDAFKPKRSNREITEEAARTFAGTADRLRSAGVPAEQVSHFLTQCLFCFFSEDVGLLPEKLFERLVGVDVTPGKMRTQLQVLFTTMRDGGLFGVESIPWFNGGLFKAVDVPALAADDVAALKAASALNWSAIDPSIFGTLFERGLDPAVRAQLGANYTDPATILRVVEPVVQRPLLAEWAEVRASIETRLTKRDELRAEAAAVPSTTKAGIAKYGRLRTRANESEKAAQTALNRFLERLRDFRVLDPACGSGNFLYLSLKCLKDIELQVNAEAEALGLQQQVDVTGPHNVLGIEVNEFAAELARVTVWIGELQWRVQHQLGFKLNPVLEPLDHIQCRDAVLNADGTEAEWPKADVVVGNPPFLGTKKQWGELGVEYSTRLRDAFAGRVPGFADLVCYWFEKARALIETGDLQRAGLVATNSIRGGANREVLDRIASTTAIFEAWSDQPWVNDGANVRVSMVSFGISEQSPVLDGKPVAGINADLTAGVDLTKAKKLASNVACSFVATVKSGSFDVSGEVARSWLKLPNPNGKSNAEVVKRWANGMDMTRRWSDTWIIDFGLNMTQADAALFEAPFSVVKSKVLPARAENKRASYRNNWWLLAEPIPKMRRALAGLTRYIATPVVAKFRLFVWMHESVLADHQLVVTARADDATFGVLHSRMHELWALRLGTALEDRPRYTPTTTFETFPFPAGLNPADTAHQRTEVLADGAVIPADLAAAVRPHAEAIARAAKQLIGPRDAWLNPPEWTDRVPEVVPLGMAVSPYPDRIVAKPGHEAELAKRTLTNLYNARPAWLDSAHAALDAAVAAAYGWTDYTADMADDELLRRLLALNLDRSPS